MVCEGPLTDIDSITSGGRSEEHTSELQSLRHLVCRLLLEKKNRTRRTQRPRLSCDQPASTPPAVWTALCMSHTYRLMPSLEHYGRLRHSDARVTSDTV